MSISCFTAYGVKVTSAEPLPLSPEIGGDYDHCIDLVFRYGPSSDAGEFPFEAPGVNMHGRDVVLFSNLPLGIERRAPERRWKFVVAGLFTMVWDHHSNCIEVSSEQKPELPLLAFWLLHMVIPVYLMLRQGSLFLHASCISIDDRAVFFIAPSFGGKSTTANYFARQGHTLMSDDKTRVISGTDGYRVYPSHPYSRASRAFETLGQYTVNHGRQAVPVKAFFVLELGAAGESAQITEVTGLEKFELLTKACLYEPVSLTEPEIKTILEMVELYPVYRADIPRNLQRLPETYDAILDYISPTT